MYHVHVCHAHVHDHVICHAHAHAHVHAHASCYIGVCFSYAMHMTMLMYHGKNKCLNNVHASYTFSRIIFMMKLHHAQRGGNFHLAFMSACPRYRAGGGGSYRHPGGGCRGLAWPVDRQVHALAVAAHCAAAEVEEAFGVCAAAEVEEAAAAEVEAAAVGGCPLEVAAWTFGSLAEVFACAMAAALADASCRQGGT